MSDIHIADFYRDAGRILLHLWITFPQKTTMYIEDICGVNEADEFGLHSKRYLSCLGTALWMAEEGYLRFGELIRQEAVDQAILSHRSFMLLSSRARTPLTLSPANVPPDEADLSINQLRHALRQESSTLLSQLVRDLLQQ